MRQMEYADSTKEISWGGENKNPIAGVLYDVHRVNVLKGVDPFAIRITDTFNYPSFLVKTNGDKQAKAAFIDMLKEQGVPEADMEWYVQSLEENIANTFEDQQNTLNIISLFTIVAIVISVMGFIGMSLFFIRQRQKEGIAAAKARGVKFGREPKTPPPEFYPMLAQWQSGTLSARAAGEQLWISHNTFLKWTREYDSG